MDFRVLMVAALGLALGFAGGYAHEEGARTSRPNGTPTDSAAMQRELSAALDIADTLERTRTVSELLSGLSPRNLDGAKAALNEKLLTTRDCDLRAIVSAWATVDPGSAFENALAWTATYKRGIGLAEAAHAWALNGGALAARSHAASAPGQDTRDAAMTGLVLGWAQSGDIAGATEHLTGHSPGAGRSKLIGAITSTIARTQGIEALLAWSEEIPSDAGLAFQTDAFRGALTVATMRRPDLAVPWWEEHQDEPYAAGSFWVIPSLWIPQEPDAAIAWAQNLPSTDERLSAIQTGIRRWYELDNSAAARWLATHPLPERYLAMLPKQAKKTIRQLRSAQ
jgi:hypothetical protein